MDDALGGAARGKACEVGLVQKILGCAGESSPAQRSITGSPNPIVSSVVRFWVTLIGPYRHKCGQTNKGTTMETTVNPKLACRPCFLMLHPNLQPQCADKRVKLLEWPPMR